MGSKLTCGQVITCSLQGTCTYVLNHKGVSENEWGGVKEACKDAVVATSIHRSQNIGKSVCSVRFHVLWASRVYGVCTLRAVIHIRLG